MVGGVVVVAAIALVTALILGRRTSWSEGRVRLVAAIPIPGTAIILAAVIIVGAWTAPAEECGVDACGMAAVGALVLAVAAGVAFVISIVAAHFGYWISKK